MQEADPIGSRISNVEVHVSAAKTLHAIRGISLDVCEGESLAIVGESGTGKSVFCQDLPGLTRFQWLSGRGPRLLPSAASVYRSKRYLAAFKTEKEWLTVRGKEIAMVMQDPMTSLNPLKTVGAQICEDR